MDANQPSQHKERCPYCGEALTLWAKNSGHCSICMQALPEELVEGDLDGEHTLHTRKKQLPTAEPDFPSDDDEDKTSVSELYAPPSPLAPPSPHDEVGHLSGDEDDDELPEDTMRYTKSNSRVLLQEDTMASAHIATSPSLPPIRIDDLALGSAPATEHGSGYDPQEHLLTEEAFGAIEQFADSAPVDLKSTAILGSLSSPVTDEHIAAQEADLADDDEGPTMRYSREERSSKQHPSQDALAATTPDPDAEQDKDERRAEHAERIASKFKQVKALLGADEKPFDIYDLEEQHTLSQPLDIEMELRRRRKKQAANPHMAASFALSQTLQDLSVKEVEELKLERARQAAKARPKSDPGLSEQPQPDPEEPSPQKKSGVPGWLVWVLGLLLWIGVGALIWKIATAPQAQPATPERRDAVARPTQKRVSKVVPSREKPASTEAPVAAADASTATPDASPGDQLPPEP